MPNELECYVHCTSSSCLHRFTTSQVISFTFPGILPSNRKTQKLMHSNFTPVVSTKDEQVTETLMVRVSEAVRGAEQGDSICSRWRVFNHFVDVARNLLRVHCAYAQPPWLSRPSNCMPEREKLSRILIKLRTRIDFNCVNDPTLDLLTMVMYI